MSLVAVTIVTAGYELVREVSRRYEASSTEYMNSLPGTFASPLDPGPTLSPSWLRSDSDDREESSSFFSLAGKPRQTERRMKTIKASLYAVQVFYSFFIM